MISSVQMTLGLFSVLDWKIVAKAGQEKVFYLPNDGQPNLTDQQP